LEGHIGDFGKKYRRIDQLVLILEASHFPLWIQLNEGSVVFVLLLQCVRVPAFYIGDGFLFLLCTCLRIG